MGDESTVRIDGPFHAPLPPGEIKFKIEAESAERFPDIAETAFTDLPVIGRYVICVWSDRTTRDLWFHVRDVRYRTARPITD